MRGEIKDTCHLYTDLAWLWPMWGDAATEYAHYCQHVSSLIRQYAKRPTATLLDIGCGGGKNVLNLKREFKVTGLDLSSAMLAQAKELNPSCTFVEGDMRTCRLDRTFDAVLMDDAISHMTCRADFEAAFRTAHAHLNPGGVLIAIYALYNAYTHDFQTYLLVRSHIFCPHLRFDIVADGGGIKA